MMKQHFSYSKLALVLLVFVFNSFLYNSHVYGQQHEEFKILHIMSYHSPWKWTDDQFNGFKDALKGMNIRYKVFQMDSKRNTSETAIQKVSREARKMIDTWQPDLVYTSDDVAQARVVTHYVNKKTPFVFSGVNANPIKYGFLGSSNVTGIMEQEHFIETIYLLKEIVPHVKKIAVILITALLLAGLAAAGEVHHILPIAVAPTAGGAGKRFGARTHRPNALRAVGVAASSHQQVGPDQEPLHLGTAAAFPSCVRIGKAGGARGALCFRHGIS